MAARKKAEKTTEKKVAKTREVHKKSSKVYHVASGKKTLCGMIASTKVGFSKWRGFCNQCANPDHDGLCNHTGKAEKIEKNMCKVCAKRRPLIEVVESLFLEKKGVLETRDSEGTQKGIRHNRILQSSPGFHKGPQAHELLTAKMSKRRRELGQMGLESIEIEQRMNDDFFGLYSKLLSGEDPLTEDIYADENSKSLSGMTRLIQFMESSSLQTLSQEAKVMATDALKETFQQWKEDCLNNNNTISDLEYLYRVTKIKEILAKL